MVLKVNIQHLSLLVGQLKEAISLEEKKAILLQFPIVQEEKKALHFSPRKLEDEVAFLSVLAIGQGPIVFNPFPPSPHLLDTLKEIDCFYQSIGGIVGYHLKALSLMQAAKEITGICRFSRAPGLFVGASTPVVKNAALKGLEALPALAEIYPIGGLGARLNLQTKAGEPLPVACLPFCGRTLLEGLVRDVQGREYLYYKLFSKQVTIPIALMTSREKRNHFHVNRICKQKKWFGRGEGNFFLFPQLSAPVITEEGNWSMIGKGKLNLHPGGHGALWRMAEEKGVFEWFLSLGKDTLLIRQINNPIAGIDDGLLSLIGVGKLQEKVFGFASCERVTHAAEGVLVLVEKNDGTRTISNIEYTDFESFGIEDTPAQDGFSHYPANTNILYADLKKILPAIQADPLPGLVLNMKMKVPFISPDGKQREVRGGRLESMMQNIADALFDPQEAPLRTFLTYNERRKTISTAKCSFEPGKKLMETPEGAFYDLLHNNHDLLKGCGFHAPPFSSPEEYLKYGPSFLCLYHPALGPTYEIIQQKIKKGKLQEESELQLEIAELLIEDLSLSGSLLITASHPMGHFEQDSLCYSNQSGKCQLKHVQVINKGIDRQASNAYWKNKIVRLESLHIVLFGNAEFFAENVIFEGNHEIIVPPGERWTAYQEESGKVAFAKESILAPTWQWKYEKQGHHIVLSQEKASLLQEVYF